MDKELEIYDDQLSLQLAGGNQDLARQMLDMLRNELPELRSSMNAAWEEGDAAAMYDSVHKINGSTRYCGVPAVGYAANHLETMIKNKESELDGALLNLNKEIDRLLSN